MEIVAKVNFEDQMIRDLINKRYAEHGRLARLVANATVIRLPRMATSTEVNLEFHLLPEIAELIAEAKPGLKAELRIEVCEEGYSGKAIVVCGFSGRPLMPYRFVRNNVEGHVEKIFFSALQGLVTLTATEDGQVVIADQKITVHDDRVAIETVPLYTGPDAETARYPQRYSNAVTAAVNRARCPGCMMPHYALEKGAFMGKPTR